MSEELQDLRQKIKIQGKQEIGARGALRNIFPLESSRVLSNGLGFSQDITRGVAQLYCRGLTVLVCPALRAFPGCEQCRSQNVPGKLRVVQPHKGQEDTN